MISEMYYLGFIVLNFGWEYMVEMTKSVQLFSQIEKIVFQLHS